MKKLKYLKYLWITILFLLGLGLIAIPNGMRFTGFLLLWTAALWVSSAACASSRSAVSSVSFS